MYIATNQQAQSGDADNRFVILNVTGNWEDSGLILPLIFFWIYSEILALL